MSGTIGAMTRVVTPGLWGNVIMSRAEDLGAIICDELTHLSYEEKRDCAHKISQILMEFVAVNAVRQWDAEEAKRYFLLADDLHAQGERRARETRSAAARPKLRLVEGGRAP